VRRLYVQLRQSGGQQGGKAGAGDRQLPPVSRCRLSGVAPVLPVVSEATRQYTENLVLSGR